MRHWFKQLPVVAPLVRAPLATANAVMDEFGIESLSSSQVSRAAKLLDEELQAWRDRPLGEIKYRILDARYESEARAGRQGVRHRSERPLATVRGAWPNAPRRDCA